MLSALCFAGVFEVDTVMDLPLAMERPNTEAVTHGSVTISFFAPRPTLPKMKIQRFVLQVQSGYRRQWFCDDTAVVYFVSTFCFPFFLSLKPCVQMVR